MMWKSGKGREIGGVELEVVSCVRNETVNIQRAFKQLGGLDGPKRIPRTLQKL